MIEPVRRLSVGRFALTLLPRQPYEARYDAAAPALGFAFDAQDGDHAFDSDRLRPYRTRANSFAYVPKGCGLISRSRRGGEYLTLTLPDALPAPQTTDRLAPPSATRPTGCAPPCWRRARSIRWRWKHWLKASPKPLPPRSVCRQRKPPDG